MHSHGASYPGLCIGRTDYLNYLEPVLLYGDQGGSFTLSELGAEIPISAPLSGQDRTFSILLDSSIARKTHRAETGESMYIRNSSVLEEDRIQVKCARLEPGRVDNGPQVALRR